MAMTKAEKAVLAAKDQEIERLQTLLALRVTEGVEPDIPRPDLFSEETRGWCCYVWSDTYRVEPVVSTSVSHRSPDSLSGSQSGVALHSTRSRALMCARAKFERLAGATLRRIDLEIARESANPTPFPEVKSR